jgi:hypothetical protein
MRFFLSLIMMVALFSCDYGCGDDSLFGASCTEMGCGDALALTLRTDDNTWPVGQYSFEISLGDQSYTCAVDIPDDLPDNPGGNCEPQLNASFRAETECTERRTKDAVSQSCTPIADHWLLEIHQSGTPKTLRVKVTRDGSIILEKDQELTYKETRPNGLDCEPVCKQSQVELILP